MKEETSQRQMQLERMAGRERDVPRKKWKIRLRVRELAKQGLTRVGAARSRSTLERLDGLMDYLWAGHWMKLRCFRVLQCVDSREEIFRIAFLFLLPRGYHPPSALVP